jgi:hypothetical protein
MPGQNARHIDGERAWVRGDDTTVAPLIGDGNERQRACGEVFGPELAGISHTGWGFEERPRQLHADIVAMKVRNLRESWRTQWWCCDWRCRI